MPTHTVRLLASDNDNLFKVKKFAHFTLACMDGDKGAQVADSISQLADHFNGPVQFQATDIVNFGTDLKPLWVLKLSLGASEDALRAKFSELFDSMMGPELNGVLYSWIPGEGQEQKCPHVTIGPNKADAEQFIGSVITFDQIDYKPLGPHDPMVTQRLLSKARPAIISSEAQKAVEPKEAEGTADNVLRPALEKLSFS